MAKGGLGKWFGEEWVNIGGKKKDGKLPPCGRDKADGTPYPKCLPKAKAATLSKSETASAVKRKRAAGNPGGKPTYVKTKVK